MFGCVHTLASLLHRICEIRKTSLNQNRSEANDFEDLVKREVLLLEVARKAAYDEEAYEILDRLLIDNNRELFFLLR